MFDETIYLADLVLNKRFSYRAKKLLKGTQTISRITNTTVVGEPRTKCVRCAAIKIKMIQTPKIKTKNSSYIFKRLKLKIYLF